MMVISIEPDNQAMILLSVPRDLYVEIPAIQAQKRINDAYRIGEEIDYPGGGGRLACDTLEKLLDITIDHYALINFRVFHTLIDAIGPIRVCPRQPIHDEKFPGPAYSYITIDFPAGCQDLDAEKLLQYARVRNNAGNDFGRMQRQQEIIQAVRAKVLTGPGLLNLVRQAPHLWRQLTAEIVTDMTVVEIVKVAEMAAHVSKEKIYAAAPSLRNGLVANHITPQEAQVLLPRPHLRARVRELFEGETGEIPPEDEGAPHFSIAQRARSAFIRVTFAALRGIARLIQLQQRIAQQRT